MKRILGIIAMLGALCMALPAEAQVKMGIKGGYNVSQFTLNGKLANNIAKGNQEGFFAGLMVEVNTPVGIGVELDAMYDQKKLETEAGTTQKLEYIDVPLNLKYTIGLSSLASVYLATGPQVAFNIGGKSFGHITDNYKEEFQLKNSELSWNVGAGFTILKHARLGYTYNIAIGNTADFNVKDTFNKAIDGELKNNTHQVALTIIF